MRLGIDAREIQNGGSPATGRSLTNFLNYFASQKNDDHCVLFSTEKIPVDVGLRVSNIVVKKRPSFLWDQMSLPNAIRDEKIDVFYSPQSVSLSSKVCWTVNEIPDVMSLAFKPYRDSIPLFLKAHDKTLGKKFAHQANTILTCSEHSKNEIIDLYGITHEKISVIPVSVEDMYKAENNFFVVDASKKFWGIQGRYVLYVGDFTLHENAECVVEAFNYLSLKFPDVQLVLAGPKKNDYDALVNRIHQLELTNRVIFPGPIAPADKPHVLFSGAEVFVFPSLYEAYGISQMQAMACGVPVVSSNTTSVPEIVKDAGLLVDPLDVAEVANAIESILSNSDLRKKLSDKGLEYVKEYSIENVSRRMYDFFLDQYKLAISNR